MLWGCATDGAGWGHDSAWPWAPPSMFPPPPLLLLLLLRDTGQGE